MDGDATILHADLDSFYASVEQRDDPRLRDRPVIVGAGIVLAASYQAKRHGVFTPMPCSQALRLCPDAVVVAPRMSAYTAASRAVFAVFDDTTPLVEPVSVDEAFLEVGGLRRISGPPVDIAHRLRARVRERVGLPITVGVARTRLLAKVASRVAKPDGLLVVDPAHERTFLDPLPLGHLWGIGPVTAAALERRGLRTVSDAAALSEPALVAMLGRASGRHVHALVHQRPATPLQPHRRRSSIGAQSALGRRPRPPEEIEARLAALVDRVARRLRSSERLASTLTLRLRLGDMTRLTRSHTWPVPTADTEVLLRAALALLHREQRLVTLRGLTLVGVAVSQLVDSRFEQLVLPLEPDRHPLDAALDDLRNRFGAGAVTRGSMVGRSGGPEMPMLPD